MYRNRGFTKEGFHSFFVVMIIFFILQGITTINPFFMLAGLLGLRLIYLNFKK